MEPTTTPVAPARVYLNTFSSLFKESLRLYKTHFNKFLLIALLPVGIGLIGSLLGFFGQDGQGHQPVWLVVIGIILGIVGFILRLVVPTATLGIIKSGEEGGRLSCKSAYTFAFKLFFPVLWLTILGYLSIIPAFVALILPGIALVMYLYFDMYTVVFDGQRGPRALSASFFYVRKYWWVVFGRLLGFALLLALLAFVLMGIGIGIYTLTGGSFSFLSLMSNFYLLNTSWIGIVITLIVGLLSWAFFQPLTLVFGYAIFKNLRQIKGPVTSQTDLGKSRKWFIGLSIAGLAIFLVYISLILSGLIKMSPSLGQQSSLNQYLFSQEVLLPISSSELDNTPYIDNEFNYSIIPPKGWEMEKYDVGVSFKKEDNIAMNVIAVKFSPEDIKGYTEEQAVVSFLSGILGGINTTKENIKTSKYISNGKTIYAVSFEGMKFPKNTYEFFAVMNDTTIYNVIGNSETNIWPEIRPIILNSVSTLKFK